MCRMSVRRVAILVLFGALGGAVYYSMNHGWRPAGIFNAQSVAGGIADQMVSVPAGEFMMGCNEAVDTECESDEWPYHRVSVSEFRIDRTEVTVEAYAKCVSAGKCSPPDSEGRLCNWNTHRTTHPINCVDWEQANFYCKWMGKQLPTEAQWEKAARGIDGRKYAWGNEGFGLENRRANIGDKYGDNDSTDGYWGTASVGSFPAGASPYGVLDMTGNVSEWVMDRYSSDAYASELTHDPRGPDVGYSQVIRGGSWSSKPQDARASNRIRVMSYRSIDIGFRCVAVPPPGEHTK